MVAHHQGRGFASIETPIAMDKNGLTPCGHYEQQAFKHVTTLPRKFEYTHRSWTSYSQVILHTRFLTRNYVEFDRCALRRIPFLFHGIQ